MGRLLKRAGRTGSMAAIALALLMAGNLAINAARADGAAAVAPEAVAPIQPALRGAYD